MSTDRLPAHERLQLLPGARELLAEHAAELPQKNDLCGAFWGCLALRAAGWSTTPDGDVLDQDAVGVRAGSSLPAHPEEEELPPGEEGRTDYRLTFPLIEDTVRSGTSMHGAIRAVGEISGDAVVAVPVSGPFAPDDVRTLLAAVRETDAPCATVLNVGTRYLWGAHPEPSAVMAYLDAGDDAVGPPPDWDVGHFVSAVGTIEGAAGTLVLIADTYGTLGPGGLHLQPLERVAHALRRPDIPGDGGVIVYIRADAADALRARFTAAGLQIGLWDNGSPDDTHAA